MSFSFSEWLIEKLGQWLLKQDPPRREYLCDFNKICHKIHRADVLLIDGRTRASKIIKRVTQSPWSHAVLYIGCLNDIKDKALRKKIKTYGDFKPDQQLLIESEIGKGTVITPIEYYQNDHIRILRAEWLSTPDVEHVIHYALGRLGRKYNLRHVFDLARFLFPWGAFPKKWRSSLFQHHALQPT